MTSGDLVAYLTAATLLFALIGKGYQTWKKHKTDQDDVAAALDRQPAIRQQLELGNWGEAIRHLNTIIVTQSEFATSQSLRVRDLEAREREMEAKVDALEADNSRLSSDNRRLDRENEQLKSENRRLIQDNLRLNEEVSLIKARLAALEKGS